MSGRASPPCGGRVTTTVYTELRSNGQNLASGGKSKPSRPSAAEQKQSHAVRSPREADRLGRCDAGPALSLRRERQDVRTHRLAPRRNAQPGLAGTDAYTLIYTLAVLPCHREARSDEAISVFPIRRLAQTQRPRPIRHGRRRPSTPTLLFLQHARRKCRAFARHVLPLAPGQRHLELRLAVPRYSP